MSDRPAASPDQLAALFAHLDAACLLARRQRDPSYKSLAEQRDRVAAQYLAAAPAEWVLESTDWLDSERVELCLTAGDIETLVTVEVRVDLPRTASEPAYREELVVVDVEGAPLDAEAEVERLRKQIVDEFWRGRPMGHA